MRFILVLLIASISFGQGGQSVVQTGVVDAHSASWRFPESTFAGLPTAAGGNTGWRYTVTDCLTSACAAGGGSVQADLRSTGSAWVVISGGSMSFPAVGVAKSTGSAWDTSYTVGTGNNNLVQLNGSAQLPAVSGALLTNLPGQGAIFDAGTEISAAMKCTHGTTSYTALTASAASQEITILGGSTPLSGNLRYSAVLMSETTQFASTTGLTVSMGRPGSTTHAELTNGATMALMISGSDANYVSTRPVPPIVNTTYSLVLNFAVTAGYVNAATSGLLTWEVCGYAAR